MSFPHENDLRRFALHGSHHKSSTRHSRGNRSDRYPDSPTLAPVDDHNSRRRDRDDRNSFTHSDFDRCPGSRHSSVSTVASTKGPSTPKDDESVPLHSTERRRRAERERRSVRIPLTDHSTAISEPYSTSPGAGTRSVSHDTMRPGRAYDPFMWSADTAGTALNDEPTRPMRSERVKQEEERKRRLARKRAEELQSERSARTSIARGYADRPLPPLPRQYRD